MKIKELNLDKIQISKNIDTVIPKKLKLSDQDFDEFNMRIITTENINKMIQLANFIEIKDIKNFIIHNTIPSKEYYKLTEENKKIVKLPLFMTDKNFLYYENKFNFEFQGTRDTVLCYEASKLGLDKWIVFGHRYNYGWFYYIDRCEDNMFNNSIIGGHLTTLKLLNKLYKNDTGKEFVFNSYYVDSAIVSNKIKILKYLHKKGCTLQQSITTMIEHNGYNELKFAQKLGYKMPSDSIDIAVRCEALNCLKILDKLNCECPWDILDRAIKYGSIYCFKYIISKNWFIEKDLAADILFKNSKNFEEEYLNPLKFRLLKAAISYDSLECLTFLLKNQKMVINDDVMKKIRGLKGRNCIKFLIKEKLISKKKFLFH